MAAGKGLAAASAACWEQARQDEVYGVLRPALMAAAARHDWKARQVRCPAGKSSAHWNPVKQHGADAIVITFSVRTCRSCPFQEQCTSSALGRRMLTLRPREPHEALVRARAEQKTETWKAKYALRAGVEGTINQALDSTGMRRAR